MVDKGLIIFLIFLGVVFVWFTAVYIKGFRKDKNRKKDLLEELDRNAEKEVEPDAVRARVISKKVDGFYSGSYKTPTYNTAFVVTFMTDAGETKEFNISKETFERIRENQYGLLLTINGNFFDFGDGEDIPAKEE